MIAIKNAQANNMRVSETVVELDETMPEESQALKSGDLSRQVVSAVGSTWVKRRVMLTSNQVFFSKIDSSDVLDHIPLHEIKDILHPSKPENPDNSSPHRNQNSHKFSKSPTNASPTQMDPLVFGDDDETSTSQILVIHTIENGHNSGRTTILLAESEIQRDEWVEFLNTSKNDALDRKNRLDDLGFTLNAQRKCRQIYSSNFVQYAIGVVIMCSYMTGILSVIFFNILTFRYTCRLTDRCVDRYQIDI